MMRPVETTVTIATTPDRVWEILTDFGRYREWNSFIREIDGTPKVGAKGRLIIAREAGKETPYRIRFSASEPDRRLAWKRSLLHPVLLEATHEFLLEADRDGRTRVVHHERFRRLLAAVVRETPGFIREGFSRFNQALKARAENPPARQA